MSYIALYRKWRPKRFSELIGQEHISKTLKNALATNKLVHAYLLCGPRGTGKTTTAKIMAKSANCLQPEAGEPCNECLACSLINEGKAIDVLEIDGASNRGIDEIRELKEQVSLAPAQIRYKVYIIDEVHMLTTEAFNALLKTLEEPPKYVLFILATTEPHKLPATILSRCQRFDFRRLSPKAIVNHLEDVCTKSEIAFERDALITIARLAKGGMRDALSLMDQCLSYGGQSLTSQQISEALGIVATDYLSEMAGGIFSGELKQVLQSINTLVNEGRDVRQLTGQLVEYLRDLLVYKICQGDLFEDMSEDELAGFQKHRGVKAGELQLMLDYLIAAEGEMRWSDNPRLLLELAFFKYIFQNHAHGEKTPDFQAEPGEAKVDSLGSAVHPSQEGPRQEQAPEQDEATTASPKADASPATPAGSGQPSLAAIEADWKRILDLVRNSKITTHAFLLEGAPLAFEDNCLIIGFQTNCSFHKEKIEQDDNKRIIEDVLAYLYKEKVRIGCELTSKKLATRAEPPKVDIVKEAAKLFNGHVMEIKD